VLIIFVELGVVNLDLMRTLLDVCYNVTVSQHLAFVEPQFMPETHTLVGPTPTHENYLTRPFSECISQIHLQNLS